MTVSVSSPTPAASTLERWAPLPPLVLVNTVAVYGQYEWAAANLPTVTIDGVTFPLWAWLFAAALESIAIYLSYEAHKARMAGDSSGKLWAVAYAVALLAGGLNYWHLAGPDHSPTPAAVAFGVMSVLSPFLWGIRSRSLQRDHLRALHLIEPRAVKFSTARWALFPRDTFAAYKLAVWAGETNPLAAIGLLERPEAARVSEVQADPTELKPAATETPAAAPALGPRLVPPLVTNPNDRKILAALDGGPLGLSDLVRASGVGKSSVQNSLRRLDGHVVKVGTLYRRQGVA